MIAWIRENGVALLFVIAAGYVCITQVASTIADVAAPVVDYHTRYERLMAEIDRVEPSAGFIPVGRASDDSQSFPPSPSPKGTRARSTGSTQLYGSFLGN